MKQDFAKSPQLAARPSEVSEQICRLSRAITNVENASEALFGQINSVLTSDKPESEIGHAVAAPESNLAFSLMEFADRLFRLEAKISAVSDRVAL